MSDVDGLLERLRKLDAEMTSGEWVHIEGQVKLRNDQPIASCWVQSGESLTFGPAQEVRDAAGIAKLRNAVREIIATIEQQRAELSANDRRIELMEAKLDAWNDLYGSEDWRSVLAAEMETDPC